MRCDRGDTLRFYEKNNLIAPASRSESGYRLYDENNQKQVTFILKSKKSWGWV